MKRQCPVANAVLTIILGISVGLVACGSGGSGPPPPPAADFSIEISPASVSTQVISIRSGETRYAPWIKKRQEQIAELVKKSSQRNLKPL